jgi:hypothetical protein
MVRGTLKAEGKDEVSPSAPSAAQEEAGTGAWLWQWDPLSRTSQDAIQAGSQCCLVFLPLVTFSQTPPKADYR